MLEIRLFCLNLNSQHTRFYCVFCHVVVALSTDYASDIFMAIHFAAFRQGAGIAVKVEFIFNNCGHLRPVYIERIKTDGRRQHLSHILKCIEVSTRVVIWSGFNYMFCSHKVYVHLSANKNSEEYIYLNLYRISLRPFLKYIFSICVYNFV